MPLYFFSFACLFVSLLFPVFYCIRYFCVSRDPWPLLVPLSMLFVVVASLLVQLLLLLVVVGFFVSFVVFDFAASTCFVFLLFWFVCLLCFCFVFILLLFCLLICVPVPFSLACATYISSILIRKPLTFTFFAEKKG